MNKSFILPTMVQIPTQTNVMKHIWRIVNVTVKAVFLIKTNLLKD